MVLQELFNKAKNLRASDIHLITSCPPLLRIDGNLQPLDGTEPLNDDDINRLFTELASLEQRELFNRDSELDFAYNISEAWRVRCNAYRQQGSTCMAIRLLPSKIPTIDDMGLPQVCKELIMRPRGLIIITGPTGSGKSTTLAAMIQHLNMTERRHVVTIEDPVEYQIEGITQKGNTKIVKGLVPLSEVCGYATSIRSLTQGRATYTMEPSCYQEVPKHIMEKIMEGRK